MALLAEQPCYTLINTQVEADQSNELQLKETLEKGDVKGKVDVVKKLIFMILNGEKVNQSLLMYVIRFCLPLSDHQMKKLLLIFWEIVPKTNAEGRLLQEMILVCDAYRKDLQHPNEFIRGSTLRFLCKLKEPELLEPLMPSIRTCLEHKHSYVRRNAVLAIFTIYRNFEFLISDAPDLISNFLEVEQDLSCKRNAFMMLIHADQQRALNYLQGCLDQVTQFGEILQLVIVELIYKVCHANPNERARFIRCVYALLQSSSAAVRYEAAGTLLCLSAAPSAVRAAAACYIDLIVKESDNNVKLIVLDRLIALKSNRNNLKILQELLMDILRVLSSPDLEVRRKTLHLALDLLSSRNVEEMVMFLKKEVSKSAGIGQADSSTVDQVQEKYRQMLVRTLHQASIRFADVAQMIVPVLMEFLSDTSELAANEVLTFVREAVQRLPHLRQLFFEQMVEVFSSICNMRVWRGAVWILGELVTNTEQIQLVMTLISQGLGQLPLVDNELNASGDQDSEGKKKEREDTELKQTVKQLVTADGTYATQSAFTMHGGDKSSAGKKGEDDRPSLRRWLADGEFFIGAGLAAVMVRLSLKFITLSSGHSKQDESKRNHFAGEAIYILACIIHYGKSGLPKKAITEDEADRLWMCCRMLADRNPLATKIFMDKSQDALQQMLTARQNIEAPNAGKGVKGGAGDEESEELAIQAQADDPIGFTQLQNRLDVGSGGENLFELSLSQALGTLPADRKSGKEGRSFAFASSKLGKVTQLTGFSDAIYAEAYVNVQQYDIVLDVLLVNQTNDTLESLTLELATLGDLRLVDKPVPITLAPQDFTNIKANVKVASTENGIIFGSLVYDVRGSTSDRNQVFLNDIHIDIMDYIQPAWCNDNEFRQMWAEFEWENKVAVTTSITQLDIYLQHLIKATNMRCLTPPEALGGSCGFMAANLYAHSVFGEDALANVSIEKPQGDPDAAIQGHIRIRAKSQGMALSLGDKINNVQKTFARPTTAAA